jgi:ligand-binding SRPBCC domain-containing protein
MRFEHRFRVQAPQEAVAAFHRSVRGLEAITPPLTPIRIHSAPEPLGAGDELNFTMWLGPLPIRWGARIEAVSTDGFTDRQTGGPFAAWAHRHNFIRLDDHTTEVHDAVEASLRPHLLWGVVGLMMWVGLPLLFAYRAARTRRLLEREVAVKEAR